MSSLPFGSWLLGPTCSAEYPYLSPDRDTWVECKRKQGYVLSLYIAILSLFILGAYAWYMRSAAQGDSDLEQQYHATLSKIAVAALVINVALLLFLPYYKERTADMEYAQYEKEFRAYHASNPRGTLSDYLNLKFGERQARASSDIAGAQKVMAGAFLLDALSGLRR